MTRVGLIGSPEREELQRLALRLEERDAEAVIFDARADPAIRMDPGRDELMGVDLASFRAFYVADLGLRPAGALAADGSLDRERSAALLRASQRHLASWTALLSRLARRALVVNPPQAWDLHGEKPFEVASLARRGVRVPATVATNDPGELVALARAGARVRKGLIGGYGYTRAFEPPRDAAAARAELASSAALVQERVVGVNVRVYVVGGRALGGAEVHPADGAEVDSRRRPGRIRRIELPAGVRRTAESVADHWRMPFAAVDFMRAEADGEWFVLECNSSPFFVELERVTGLAISGALADHLTQRGHREAAR